MEGLHDKVIVFASASGIAAATMKFLGAGGARIVVGDVVEASAEATAQPPGTPAATASRR
ncbi:hypothetical protein [Nonomuraea sp. NPDC049480]|uniref:hypothetical protein n=1 Tax=Nonomuraea sp. NPDC049480 TaxID=3364353 RepID=UPI0037ABD09E